MTYFVLLCKIKWGKRQKHIRQKKKIWSIWLFFLIYLLFEYFIKKWLIFFFCTFNRKSSTFFTSWILYIFFSELCRNNPLKEEIIIKIRTMRIKGKVKFSIYPLKEYILHFGRSIWIQAYNWIIAEARDVMEFYDLLYFLKGKKPLPIFRIIILSQVKIFMLNPSFP